MMIRRFTIGVAVFSVLAVACDGPMKPTPTPDAPTLACPANVTMRGVSGGMQPVTYTAPTVTGGAAPVTVTCAPKSGDPFTVGTTPVACSAVDTIARRAECSFTVTLTPLLLSVTKFVAIGDSFTEGEDGRTATLGFGFIDPSGTYPFLLQVRLNNEYSGQSILVVNRGKSGEPIYDVLEPARLPSILASDKPDALLFLDGYNNLLGSCDASDPQHASSAACEAATSEVADGYRRVIQAAKAAGVKYVFASTLTPPGPYRSGRDRRIAASAIERTNSKLTATISAQSAVVVDAYPVFIGHEADYVADDGLHLRRAGYQALADTFFAAIKNAVASTPAFDSRP
jgi:lysophospholipase L1-like esterase